MKKKLIATAITCVVIAILVVLAIKFGNSTTKESEPMEMYSFDAELSKDVQVISNGTVSLKFDPATTRFVFTDKFGNEWSSNPDGAESSGNDVVQSLLYIEYKNKNGVKFYLNTNEHSVKKENYTYSVDTANNTIKIDFSVGLASKTYVIPTVLSEARYNELKEKLTPESFKLIRDGFKPLNPERLKKNMDEFNELAEQYPDLKEGLSVYTLFTEMPNYKKERIEAALRDELNYSKEDLEQDEAYAKIETKNELKPNINLSLLLKLDGEELVAEIPFDSVKFYPEYPVTRVDVLPFMCASGMQDEGFMFVPDGSGAYINFNNGKVTQSVYNAKVYGWDYAQERDIVVTDPLARFPVYGISFTDKNVSLLAMLENGDSYAEIEADVAGKVYNYNYVTNRFSFVHNQICDVTGRSTTDFYMFEKELPKGESVSVRYKPVDSSDYVDMAKAYREYITKRYPELANINANTSLPVAVELLGAVKKMQHILGFPKEKPYDLSTYDEMAGILKELKNSGWEDVDVILNGWFNKGVTHEWPDDIDLIGRLGSKKDFKNLLATAKGYGYNISGRADFTFVQNDELLDGFRPKRDASRFLSREVAEFKAISDIWYGEDEESDSYYLARPEYSSEALNKYLKDAKKLGLESIAFNSIGNKLGANYHRKKNVSRQEVLNQQVAKLAELKGNRNVIYEGNLYALPYADIVLDFPLLSERSSIEDGTLPFFEIALHGYVRYTGASVNITNDYITNLLKSAETGAGLYFVFMDAEASELTESDHTEYFGASYDSWKDEATSIYQDFKEDFGPLTNQTIEGHKELADNVFVTEYSNGTKVYVNYRTTEYTAEGVTIPAQDWVVVKKGGN